MPDDNRVRRQDARVGRRRSRAALLSAHDWARAAAEAIATDGIDSVSVEGLGRKLGVSKGSFYWHFPDRAALIAAALALWEKEATLDVIAALRPIADPVDRLRALFDVSFGDTVEGPLDAAIVARVNDPVVGPVVERVAATRVAFLEELFRDLGFSPAKAAAQARITYCAYVGHHQVRRSLPDDPMLANPSKAYLRQLLETLSQR